jgi:hypothetical protein
MKKLITLLIAINMLVSCTTDDQTNSLLQGKWFMASFLTFGPSNPDLSEEYILWNINTENNTLNVVNYYTEHLFVFPTGEYPFTYTNSELLIDNGTSIISFDYEFNNGELILSNHPELDGPIIRFSQKETDCINHSFENLQWLHDIKVGLEINLSISAGQIIQYVYNNNCVYLVDDCFNCDDSLVQVYDIDGEIICQFGGIAGLNTCSDFFDTATHKRYLFNNVNRNCNDVIINTTSLENEYACVNTKFLMDINLTNDFTIIHTQNEFDTLVSGDCQPQIDFNTYDLVIGKQNLANGNDSIVYELIKDCVTNNLTLKVTFNQNATEPAPILTYHALIPKLNPSQTLEVDIVIN